MKFTVTKDKIGLYFHLLIWKGGKCYKYYRVGSKSDIQAVRNYYNV